MKGEKTDASNDEAVFDSTREVEVASKIEAGIVKILVEEVSEDCLQHPTEDFPAVSTDACPLSLIIWAFDDRFWLCTLCLTILNSIIHHFHHRTGASR